MPKNTKQSARGNRKGIVGYMAKDRVTGFVGNCLVILKNKSDLYDYPWVRVLVTILPTPRRKGRVSRKKR